MAEALEPNSIDSDLQSAGKREEGRGKGEEGRGKRTQSTIRNPLPLCRWHRPALVAILLLAAVLRFGGITRVGIRFEDEGWYAGDARLWHRCMRVLTDADAVRAMLGGDKPAFQQRMDAIGVDFAGRYTKPSQGYTILGSVMMFAVGDRPAALLVVNALCGTLAVAALYGLAVTLFDRRVALCAALLLAVSPYHLVYCRSAYPEASMGLFVLIGAAIWARGYSGHWPLHRAYLLSGIALGYAVSCHYRSAYVPLVFILVELLAAAQDRRHALHAPLRSRLGMAPTPGEVNQVAAAPRGGRNPVPFVRRWALFACGFLIPLLAIEGVFRLGRLAAIWSDSYMPLATFFEAGGRRLAKHTGAAFGETSLIHPQVLEAYISYFLHWHGLAAVVLAAVGLAVVLRAKGATKVTAIFVLLTAGLLLFQQFKLARTISAAVPFFCLLLSAGVVWCVSRCKPVRMLRPVLTVVLLVAVAGPASVNAWHLYGKRSHLEDACAFVADQGGGAVAVTNRCRFWLYLERTGTAIKVAQRDWPVSPPEEAVSRLRADGVRWLITEPRHWLFQPGSILFSQWQRLEEHLAQEAVLAAEFPHVSDYRWEFLAESQGPGLGNLPEMKRMGGGPLRVYDLQVQRRPAGTIQQAMITKESGHH